MLCGTTILIGAPEIRTAESAIQEFARKVPDPLSKKVGSGKEAMPEKPFSIINFKVVLWKKYPMNSLCLKWKVNEFMCLYQCRHNYIAIGVAT